MRAISCSREVSKVSPLVSTTSPCQVDEKEVVEVVGGEGGESRNARSVSKLDE